MERVCAVLAILCCLGVSSHAAEKVEMGFYSEALCPDCIALSNGPLKFAFDNISEIFTLKYVPWGNAEVKQDHEIVCQHGPTECVMNTVQACALYYYPNMTQFWPFLHCLDSKYGIDQDIKSGKKCAESLGMDWDKIDTCATGKQGLDLELMYAKETAALDPPHEYTPWVTINGKHDEKAEGKQLTEVICKAYTGKDKPKVCNDF